MFKCKSCDCQISPGTSKCPNCDANPFIAPKSYSRDEWNGRKNFFSKRKEAGSLESLINNEKII